MQIIDQITSIAPQYRPSPADLEWFGVELERVQRKALPKLIRKRFIDGLKAAVKPTTPARSVSNSAPEKTADTNPQAALFAAAPTTAKVK